MTELTYMKNGDYRIPDLKLSEEPGSKPLGKYGMLRKTYLQEHRPILWNQMILSETLFPHLREIDETAHRRLEQMMPVLMQSAGVTEALPLKRAARLHLRKLLRRDAAKNRMRNNFHRKVLFPLL